VNVLKLGIPKGSLQEATINLFKKSGWKINLNSRNYFPEIVIRKFNAPSAGPRKCPVMWKVELLMRE